MKAQLFVLCVSPACVHAAILLQILATIQFKFEFSVKSIACTLYDITEATIRLQILRGGSWTLQCFFWLPSHNRHALSTAVERQSVTSRAAIRSWALKTFLSNFVLSIGDNIWRTRMKAGKCDMPNKVKTAWAKLGRTRSVNMYETINTPTLSTVMFGRSMVPESKPNQSNCKWRASDRKCSGWGGRFVRVFARWAPLEQVTLHKHRTIVDHKK